ncbi:MAG: thioredoxin [Saprospiraceae bacterium]|nr:thioredoxin [Saprospiraceae bacterium]
MALQFTDSNFKAQVLESSSLAVVDFWAVWCGPCKAIAPIIDDLSTEYEGRAVIGKVDVDNNPDVAMEYNIRSIPTILLIKNGTVVERQVGATTKAALKNLIEKHV